MARHFRPNVAKDAYGFGKVLAEYGYSDAVCHSFLLLFTVYDYRPRLRERDLRKATYADDGHEGIGILVCITECC